MEDSVSDQIREFNQQVSEQLKESRKEIEANKNEIKKSIEEKKNEEKQEKLRGALLLNFDKNEKARIEIFFKGKDKVEKKSLDDSKYSCSFDDLKFGRYLLNIILIEGEHKRNIEKFVLIDKVQTKEEKFDFKK